MREKKVGQYSNPHRLMREYAILFLLVLSGVASGRMRDEVVRPTLGRPVEISMDTGIALLAQIYPNGSRITTTSITGSESPVTCWSVDGKMLLTINGAWAVPVTDLRADSLVFMYEINRDVFGFWFERQYGVAVFNNRRLMWHVESDATFSTQGGLLDIVKIRKDGLNGLRLTCNFTGDSCTPRSYQQRERLYAFIDGEFRQLLDDTTPTNAAKRLIEVSYNYGAFDSSGWCIITKTANEKGAVRKTSFRYTEGNYRESADGIEKTNLGVDPVAIQGPITLGGPELAMVGRLWQIAVLDSYDFVVHKPENWPGPDSGKVLLSGGWLKDSGNILLFFDVKTVMGSYPVSTKRLEVSDHCEVWLWDRKANKLWQWALSPGDQKSIPPSIHQWMPLETDNPKGLKVRSQETLEGYSILLEIDSTEYSIDMSDNSRYRMCLSTYFNNVYNGKPAGFMMASTRTYRWKKPETFNPVQFLKDKPLAIVDSWFHGWIVSVDRNAGRVIIERDDSHMRRRNMGKGAANRLDYVMDKATSIRGPSMRTLGVEVLIPGDRAEVHYEYRDGLRMLRHIKPSEKYWDGDIVSIDTVSATIVFKKRGKEGVTRTIVVPPDAARFGWDSSTRTDLSKMQVGDYLQVGYVGPEDTPTIIGVGSQRKQ